MADLPGTHPGCLIASYVYLPRQIILYREFVRAVFLGWQRQQAARRKTRRLPSRRSLRASMFR